MRLLVTGATGALGGYLLRHLAGTDMRVTAWSGCRAADKFGIQVRPVDLADQDAVVRAFRQARPDVVVHTAAIASLAQCYRDPVRAQRVNVAGTALLADLAVGARLVLVSTDLIFDGERGDYHEQDAPSPLSTYGRTKVAAEQTILGKPGGVVARVSLLFGPTLTDRGTFFDQQVRALRSGQPVTCFEDEWRTPLGLGPAARALLALVVADFVGLIHVGGPERLSRLEMGRRLAEVLGADPDLVVAVPRAAAAGPEPRPRDTSLVSAKWRRLFPGQSWPSWDAALREMELTGGTARPS